MAYFCDCDATNDKNRFYGLAGLSSNNHGFDVDYSLGAEEVYLRFAKSFITQHNSLDTISFAVIFAPEEGYSLLSWSADWRTRVQPLVAPLMENQSATDFLGNLRPPWFLENDNVKAQHMAGDPESRVRIRGLDSECSWLRHRRRQVARGVAKRCCRSRLRCITLQ